MSVNARIPPEEIDAAWRFFLVNWIGVGAMGAVLALSLLVTNFSLELPGLRSPSAMSASMPALPTPMPGRRAGAIRR